jgi:hypothetical protein
MEASQQTRSTRLIFLSIVGIPVTVVLAATWLWFFVARGDLDLVAILGTSNHGSLVQPARSLDEGNLVNSAGAVFSYSDLPPQWTFLVPGKGRCGVDCEKLLYLTRQIHLAMGKNLPRIRRFYVSDSAVPETVFDVDVLSDKRPAPSDFVQYMESEQQGMKAFTVSPDKHASLFAETYDEPTTWYLVDPAGWIMMSYTSEISYKKVIADLKFLLKNSSE